VRLLVIALLVALVLGACWRGGASTAPPQPSFIARRNAMLELRRSVNALSPKLDLVGQRIAGLASEVSREAIGQDLADLEREVAELSRYTLDARTRGDSRAFLDAIERDLEHAALVLVNLRDELRYAKTTAELAALDELSRDTSTEPAVQRRLVIRRLIETLPSLDPDRRVMRRRANAVIETP
jgi:hypothetical protein